MLKQISEAFNSGNYNASLSLLLEEVEPEGDVNTLIDSMRELSRFSTEFATSNESRSRNVQKAAGLLNCVILEPGEELSYNELLGPRTEELGWLPAHGISGGKEYIDTPGGGICQVSSTLYNSLLLIGPDIRIVSRSHHSIPGSYVAMGLDATLPNPNALPNRFGRQDIRKWSFRPVTATSLKFTGSLSVRTVSRQAMLKSSTLTNTLLCRASCITAPAARLFPCRTAENNCQPLLTKT